MMFYKLIVKFPDCLYLFNSQSVLPSVSISPIWNLLCVSSLLSVASNNAMRFFLRNSVKLSHLSSFSKGTYRKAAILMQTMSTQRDTSYYITLHKKWPGGRRMSCRFMRYVMQSVSPPIVYTVDADIEQYNPLFQNIFTYSLWISPLEWWMASTWSSTQEKKLVFLSF